MATETLTIKVSPSERQTLNAAAASRGITVAQLVRSALADQGVPIKAVTRKPPVSARNTAREP